MRLYQLSIKWLPFQDLWCRGIMELNVNSLTLLPMGKSDNIYRWQSALLICPLKSILRRHSLELLARDIPTISLYGYVKF